MARSRNNGDVAELFDKVVTEGPLEELMNQCDVVTSACLVGSSNLFLQSAMLSATMAASQPFGLPCILHTHPTRRPWEYNQPWPVGMECSLTPLDRLSSDALMPNSFSEQRAGSNGDWIVTVGRRGNWNLVNVYTRHKIALPPLPGVEATDSPLTFTDRGGYLELQKISICQVPTAAGLYNDYSLVAIFDFKIAVLQSYFSEWVVLENQFQDYFSYCDAIIHQDLVFAVVENGCVYAWNPLSFGKFSSLYIVLDYFRASLV